MKGFLQIMLVSLSGTAYSLGAYAAHPDVSRAVVQSHGYPEFIIQESHMIEDGKNNLNSHVTAPQSAGSKTFKAPAARGSEQRNTVTINFTGIIDPNMRPTIRFYKEDDFFLTGEIIASERWIDEKTVMLSMPNGVYDIFVYWTEFYSDVAHSRHCLVAKEDVSVNSDEEYTYDRADAPNYVDFHHTLPNGDEPRWPGVKYDDETGNPTRDWSNDANVGKTNCVNTIMYPKYGFNIAHNSIFNAASDGEILDKFDPYAEMRLWCGELPSEMWITQHIIMENEKGEIYSSMASTSVNEGANVVEVGNEGYYLISEELEHSPYFYENNFLSDVSACYTINEEVLGFPGFSFSYNVAQGEKKDIYILTRPWYYEDKDVTLNYVTQTLYDRAVEVSGPFGSTMFDLIGIKSPEIYSHDGSGYYMGTRYDDFLNHYIFSAPEGGYYRWPGVILRNNFHPVFSYEAGLRKQKLGNNVPIMSVLTLDYGQPSARIPIASPAIKGRYGESRVIDSETLSTTLSIGGEKLYEGSWSGLVGFMFDSYWNSPDGLVEVVFADNNVSVDCIDGKNITEFSYGMTSDDVWAPTLQMLHFKDAEGYVNDRFVNASDGTIEFAGGDFIEHFNDENYYWYTEEEAEVKLEYAPYGTDAFMPLEVTEIPELYFMPGYGHFYRGSLGGVDRGSSNGWFDIRISLTDAAGNCQRQTLSPAFKVESLAGVDAVIDNAGSIKVEGRNIIVPEGSKIFTVQGTLSNGRNVQPGIYLVKTSAGTSKIIVR